MDVEVHGILTIGLVFRKRLTCLQKVTVDIYFLVFQAYELCNAGSVIHSHGIESCLVTMINPSSKEFRVSFYYLQIVTCSCGAELLIYLFSLFLSLPHLCVNRCIYLQCIDTPSFKIFSKINEISIVLEICSKDPL